MTRQFGVADDTTEDQAETPVDNSSVYDDLRQELAAPVEMEELSLVVPARPNIEMIFDPTIEFDMLKTWIKRSTKGVGKKQDIDPLLFSFQVLSFTNVGMKMRGQEVHGDEGDRLTFAHKETLAMLKATTVQNAMRRLYGAEGHIIRTAQEVVDAAGYGDDIDIESGNSNPLEI